MSLSTGPFAHLFMSEFSESGYLLVQDAVDQNSLAGALRAIESAVNTPDSTGTLRKRGGRAFAIRNVLAQVPELRRLAIDGPMHQLAVQILGSGAHPIRATLFDKTPEANWVVPWHQDTAIPVARRVDGVPGFDVWSVKAGQDYCEAPAPVLESIVALRLHLDPCGLENGPLRIIPASHRHGRLTSDEISQFKASGPALTICANAGDILAMNPLLLHASSPASAPHHRRVLHVEYTTATLPGGLEWASAG